MLPELVVRWFKKKYNSKTRAKFENSQHKCCLNEQVKKYVDILYDPGKSKEEKKNEAGMMGSYMSLIHIYFKDLEAVKYSVQENYGIMDMIGKYDMLEI